MKHHLEEGGEKIKDVLCIMNLLESDMEQQNVEEVYVRVIKHIHRIMSEVYMDIIENVVWEKKDESTKE